MTEPDIHQMIATIDAALRAARNQVAGHRYGGLDPLYGQLVHAIHILNELEDTIGGIERGNSEPAEKESREQ